MERRNLGISKLFLGMKKSIATRTINFLLTTTLFLAVIVSCRTVQNTVDQKDLSYLYNPIKNPINPRFNVTNQTDTTSLLSVKFFASDLYFSEANPKGISAAMILISVKLLNISQGKIPVDTAVVNLTIEKESGKQEYVYAIPLKVEKGIEYIAEVRILDRLRLKIVQSFVSFNTLSYNNKYNFRALGHFAKNELFSPVLRINEFVNLVYERGPVDSLFISFYKPFKDVPDPPSMLLPEKTLDYEPDRVVAIQYTDTTPMMFPKQGIYFCTTARNSKEGYTLLNFGSSFPSMTTPEVMIEPLVYLASRNEIEDLNSSVKPKVALDEFWIKCGGNIDKARELIRIYYTRVLYSNYYFTSYKEGWRTERGMIYLMYGPPDKVYKTSEGESWGYNKGTVKSSWGSRYSTKEDYLFFNFKKRKSNFSDNDYFLSRSETLVTFWDQAVNSWRKGVVFRLDNPEDF
jgi:GWxTD domain-containing protein